MGWFDEQIRQRKENDDAMLSDAVCDIVGAVSGKEKKKPVTNAIDEILKFYRLKASDVPDTIKETDDKLEYLLRPHGIMRRRIELKKGWHKNALCPLLVTRKGGDENIALIPRNGKYVFYDFESGKRCKVTSFTEELFESEALCFYKPFPRRKLSKKELISYIFKSLPKRDFVYFAFITLASILISLTVPTVYKSMLKSTLYHSAPEPLLAAVVFLVSITVSAGLFMAAKRLMIAKIKNQMRLSLESATMMRILSLPVAFFKKHSSGDLSNRVEAIGETCETVAESVINMGMTAAFSLVFVFQIYMYAHSLIGISVFIILLHMIFSVICGRLQTKVKRKQIKYNDKEQGISYALISGIEKIKLAGAEKRAFSKWASAYSKTASATYNPPFILKIKNVIGTAITLVGAICIYFIAAKSNVSVADYYAFNSAYAIASVAFLNFVEITVAIADAKSKLDDVHLFFETEPETSSDKVVITKLSGSIELCNVSFKYNDAMPNVIDNLSLKIEPGQYVAIVGQTGCGKSTLMRLMLGFEKAQNGVIYYDKNDIDKIDLKSLRQKIGVVMQDGKLFCGDIFSNIAIANPSLTVDEVWEAAEKAGIAEDIKKMPMGMKTTLTEGGGGISGGQKQRILIARAIVSKPKILMFDEATSALDNVTQKNVADALANLNCTRIVIAHRLSTIKQCDKIFVLDKGKIVQAGTFDELLQEDGLFCELVSKQKIE